MLDNTLELGHWFRNNGSSTYKEHPPKVCLLRNQFHFFLSIPFVFLFRDLSFSSILYKASNISKHNHQHTFANWRTFSQIQIKNQKYAQFFKKMSIVSLNENIFYQILNLKSLLSVSSTLPNFVPINSKPTWGTTLSSLAMATTHQICKEKRLISNHHSKFCQNWLNQKMSLVKMEKIIFQVHKL